MNSCKNIKNSLTFYVSTYLQDRYIPGVHLADMMFVTHENAYSDLHDNCHNRIMEEDPGMVNLVEVKVKGQRLPLEFAQSDLEETWYIRCMETSNCLECIGQSQRLADMLVNKIYRDFLFKIG